MSRVPARAAIADERRSGGLLSTRVIDVEGRRRRLGATPEERLDELARIVDEAYCDARALNEGADFGEAGPFIASACDHLALARERLARGRQAL